MVRKPPLSDRGVAASVSSVILRGRYSVLALSDVVGQGEVVAAGEVAVLAGERGEALDLLVAGLVAVAVQVIENALGVDPCCRRRSR